MPLAAACLRLVRSWGSSLSWTIDGLRLETGSILDQIRRDWRSFWSSFFRKSQQEVQILCLFFIQVDEPHAKAEPMMVMPHLTFKIEPVSLRKEYAKGDDLAGHYLANRVEVATAFGKIGDASGVSFLSTVPNRIEAHAQTWFRPSIIHDPSIIGLFDEVKKD